MITFKCMRCERKLVVPDTFQNKQVRCPQCSNIALVPKPKSAASTYRVDQPVATGPHPKLQHPAPPANPLPSTPIWIEYLRASKPVVAVSLLIIAFGSLWLLDALSLLSAAAWMWPAGLAITGLLTLFFAGINKQTLIVGPYLIICAVFAIARQNDLISLRVEIPSLIIAFGLLLLVVTMAGYALPDIVTGESFTTEQRKQRGQCTACGYDMRGTPSRICPECGHNAKRNL